MANFSHNLERQEKSTFVRVAAFFRAFIFSATQNIIQKILFSGLIQKEKEAVGG